MSPGVWLYLRNTVIMDACKQLKTKRQVQLHSIPFEDNNSSCECKKVVTDFFSRKIDFIVNKKYN